MSNNKEQTPLEWLREEITYDNGHGARWGSFKETVDLTPYFNQAIDMDNIAKQEAYNQGFAKAKSLYLDAE
jgi:hypothetical protein